MLTRATLDDPIRLSREQKDELLSRYRRPASADVLTYGTVEDFCDSSDHVGFLSHVQGDLKDLQRPAALKIILGLLPVSSKLLEVGAGEPHVAHALSEFGYNVTVVDPYDGSGNGPTQFECYVKKYPKVQIVRDLFTDRLDAFEHGTFDCIYSISVLEHVHQPHLSGLFRGVKHFLKPGGYSLHLIDHVLTGEGEQFHLTQLAEILALQSELAAERAAQVAVDLAKVVQTAAHDPDTYYLSAAGHNSWRGATPYANFRYRKVISIHSCKRMGVAKNPSSFASPDAYSPS